MKEPKIRFKGFQGEWKSCTIKDICEVNPKSTLPSVFEYVDLESVVGTEMVSHRTEKRESAPSRAQRVASKGDIFYQTVRPYQKNNYLFDKDDTNYVFSTGYAQLRTKIYGGYLFTLMQSLSFVDKVLMECTGTSYPAINPTNLSKIKVHIIDNENIQKAIASYFQHLDALIQSTTKKIESLKQVKAASLQTMFLQEGETTPRVRFNGFEGEWEKVSLKKYAKRINRKNKNMESTLALTISSIEGLVSQIDYFNNLVVGANLANYYLLKNGEFAYNKSYSRGYPFGSVKRLDRYDQGILSTLYIVFSVNDEISSDYLARFFDTTLWHKPVAERAEEGARNHGLLNIGADDFMTIDIVVPTSRNEQQQIADFFTNLDSQITLQTQRLEKLKQIKSACLDNMFV